MPHEAPPTLDILKVYEYLGGQLPAHIKSHGWTPVRCIVHDGFSGSINAEANKVWCFGCHESRGDGYDLLRLVEGVQLAEAQELGERMGWFVDSGPTRGPARKTARPKRPDRTDKGRKPRK